MTFSFKESLEMNKKQLIAELTNFGKNKKPVVDLICRSEFSPITIITALSEALANLSNWAHLEARFKNE